LTVEFLDDFRKECEALSLLKHPHIMQVYGVGEGSVPASWPDGLHLPCICCELLQGGTLLDFVKNSTKEDRTSTAFWRSAYVLLADVAAALTHMHAAGVMHRDLKSANLMLSCGRAKLVDFGLAKPYVKHTHWRAAHTSSIGTYYTKAPEMNTGSYGLSSDIFSFGILLTEVLSGHHAENIVDETRTGKFGLNVEGVRNLMPPEQQQLLACQKLVALAEQCCSLLLEERPSASDIAKTLEEIP